jgi:glycine cleavage system H protein
MKEWILPETLRYTPNHLWVAAEGGLATVGVTDFAQDWYGRAQHGVLPSVGATIRRAESFGAVQMLRRGIWDLYPPVTGAVVEVNTALHAAPELINESPYEEGWLVKVRVEEAADLEDLYTVEEYRAALAPLRRPQVGGLIRKVLDGTADPMLVIDQNRRVVACNPAAERLTGWHAQEIAGQHFCHELFGCAEEAGECLRRGQCPGLEAFRQGGPVYDADYVITTRRGLAVPVRSRYEIVQNEADGQPYAVITMRESSAE